MNMGSVVKGWFGLLVLASLLWSGWWFVGRTGKVTAFETWIEERQAAGWDASHESLSVTGFPNRFDTTVQTLRLADPAAGWAWATPRFLILALSYQPNHVILGWPDEQFLVVGRETLTVGSSKAQASLVVDAGESLPFNRASLVVPDMTVVSDAGWEGKAAEVTVHARRAVAADGGEQPGLHAYDLALAAREVALPDWLRQVIDPEGGLPAAVSALEAEATVTLDGPVDRRLIEGGPLKAEHIRVTRARFDWGGLRAHATGAVAIRADGRPDGAIEIVAWNWRAFLAAAEQVGVVSSEWAKVLSTGLTAAALLTGDPDRLSVDLTFRDGQTYLGPVSLGPAPVLLSP